MANETGRVKSVSNTHVTITRPNGQDAKIPKTVRGVRDLRQGQNVSYDIEERDGQRPFFSNVRGGGNGQQQGKNANVRVTKVEFGEETLSLGANGHQFDFPVYFTVQAGNNGGLITGKLLVNGRGWGEPIQLVEGCFYFDVAVLATVTHVNFALVINVGGKDLPPYTVRWTPSKKVADTQALELRFYHTYYTDPAAGQASFGVETLNGESKHVTSTIALECAVPVAATMNGTAITDLANITVPGGNGTLSVTLPAGVSMAGISVKLTNGKGQPGSFLVKRGAQTTTAAT